MSPVGSLKVYKMSDDASKVWFWSPSRVEWRESSMSGHFLDYLNERSYMPIDTEMVFGPYLIKRTKTGRLMIHTQSFMSGHALPSVFEWTLLADNSEDIFNEIISAVMNGDCIILREIDVGDCLWVNQS
ncbi:hypothetical protein [Vibrio phage vB_VpaP_SJSY21]|nr:hypothetical protein [Vibrio phage vB_VpaP_SJSY21]